jgi:hypothetical protein
MPLGRACGCLLSAATGRETRASEVAGCARVQATLQPHRRASAGYRTGVAAA